VKNIRFLFWGIAFVCIYSISTQKASSQITEHIYRDDYRIDPEKKGELLFELDDISFFKNNEFDSDYLKGYSLPGYWLQPTFVFYPGKNIKLQAGAHMLHFWGADQYPNFAYSDIAYWKGDSYQHKFHIVPYFRVHFSLNKNLDVIIGNTYGGAAHKLIDPLYNPELNLIADPENGLQLIHTSRFIDTDIWLNWESFIFQLDTHQEAFTVGLSSRLKYNDPKSRLHFYSPIQVFGQHRGGEIDTIFVNSVQMIFNGAIGVGATWNFNRKVLKNINLEVDATGYYQQAGKLVAFDKGYGLYAQASAQLASFKVKGAYWTSKDFVSLFGSPFYGNISSSKENFKFVNPKMLYLSAEYFRELGKGYSLGVDVDIYRHLSGNVETAEGNYKKKGSTSFAIGAYFRINPSFLIKKF